MPRDYSIGKYAGYAALAIGSVLFITAAAIPPIAFYNSSLREIEVSNVQDNSGLTELVQSNAPDSTSLDTTVSK